MFFKRQRGPRVPRSTYVPGDSVLHRIPAGFKASALIIALLVSALFVKGTVAAAIVLAISLALYAVARIPLRVALLNLRTPLPVLLILCGMLWWTMGWHIALHRFLILYSAVSLAMLLTLTTKVSEMMEALEKALRPLERWGFPVENVTLALSLTMRLIPLQMDAVHQVLDARKARGSSGSPLAFGVPVVIQTLLRAKALGDALISRGVGD